MPVAGAVGAAAVERGTVAVEAAVALAAQTCVVVERVFLLIGRSSL